MKQALDTWRGIALLALSALALSRIALYAVSASIRIPIDLPIGPFEDSMVQGIARIETGAPLYAAASDRYVALLYGPVLSYAGALVAKLTGCSYLLAGRAVAVSGLAGIALFLHLIFRNKRSPAQRWPEFAAAIIAFGLMIAVIDPGLFHFDGVRNDGLLILFGLLALWSTQRLIAGDRAIWIQCILAASLALAFLCKQSGAAFGIAAWLILLIAGQPRIALWSVIASVSLVALTIFFLSLHEGNYPWHFIAEIPTSHPLDFGGAIAYFVEVKSLVHLLGAAALGGAILKSIHSAAGVWRNGWSELWQAVRGQAQLLLFVAFGGAALAMSFAGAAKQGGAHNSLIYGGFFLSLAAIQLAFFEDWTSPVAGAVALVLFFAFSGLQFVRHLPAEFNQIQAAQKLAALAPEYRKTFCALESPSLNFQAGFLPEYWCGRESTAAYIAMIDLSNHAKQLEALRSSMIPRLRSRYYKRIYTTTLYAPELIAAALGEQRAALARANSPKKRQRLQNIIHLSELQEEMMRSYFHETDPKKLSAAELNYIRLEKERSGAAVHVLSPRF